VPWCEECAKFWTPTSLDADGSCPSCGRTIAVAVPEPRAPWHFKLLVAAVVVYLGYRLVQLAEWLI
jgi:uncharacterized paraquat-inducible protein A